MVLEAGARSDLLKVEAEPVVVDGDRIATLTTVLMGHTLVMDQNRGQEIDNLPG